MSSFDPRYREDHAPGRIAIALTRIAQAVGLELREAGQAAGLSAAQVQALLFLAYARPGVRTVGGLAERLGCSHPTASGIVDALERKGLVERSSGTLDRRTTVLRLTAGGRRAVDGMDGALARLESVVEGLSEADQAAAERALQRIVAGLVDQGLVRVYEMCWNCTFFRRDAHPEDQAGAHHCAFMDAPLPEADTYTECPDFTPAGRTAS
jgi:DNA-binding MarR family transcriptional regulator